MSFGYGVGDFIALSKLVWDVVQNSRNAFGAHNELTREVTSLHIVLQALEQEVSKPESLLNRQDDKDNNRQEQLAVLASDCRRVTRRLSRILEKYNAVSDEKWSATRMKQRIQFGNGEMKDLDAIRIRLGIIIQRASLFINIISLGSQGRVEQVMNSGNGAMKEMMLKVDLILASQQAKTRERSISTSYAEDDKMFWREFRRELVKAGFPSSRLKKHRALIKDYVKELGASGVLDDREFDALPTLDENLRSHSTIPTGLSTFNATTLPKMDNEALDKEQELSVLEPAQTVENPGHLINDSSSEVSSDDESSAADPQDARYANESYPHGTEKADDEIPRTQGSFYNDFPLPRVPFTGNGCTFPLPQTTYFQTAPLPLSQEGLGSFQWTIHDTTPTSINWSIIENFQWYRDLMRKMKEPIEWETLTTILSQNGTPECHIGVKWNSPFIIDLCKRARDRYGGTKAGTIIMEPVRTKTKKKKGMFRISSVTTTMQTWDPCFTPSKF